MNRARWDADRLRRDSLALAEPVKHEGEIRRRVIVIDDECRVRETVIYRWETAARQRRKERSLLA